MPYREPIEPLEPHRPSARRLRWSEVVQVAGISLLTAAVVNSAFIAAQEVRTAAPEAVPAAECREAPVPCVDTVDVFQVNALDDAHASCRSDQEAHEDFFGDHALIVRCTCRR